MMSSICSFLVIFSVISNVQGVCREPTELTLRQIRAVLKAHNHHRSQADDAADMRKPLWSDEMASLAQHHAHECRALGPTVCDPYGDAGHNIYLFNNTEYVSTADISTMVQEWANEKDLYNITTGTCSVTAGCNHYKQLVWASTSEVGCGIKQCTFVEEHNFFRTYFRFVCYYNPDGNNGDRKPYRRGLQCSKCGKQIPGPWCGENNLCVEQ